MAFDIEPITIMMLALVEWKAMGGVWRRTEPDSETPPTNYDDNICDKR